MIRCNGSYSDGRANPAKRTRTGKTDPSAPRERHCCAVFVSSAVRSKTMPPPSYERSPSFIVQKIFSLEGNTSIQVSQEISTFDCFSD
jgi:hypothetical protein